jgi:hypothetical protein
MTRPAYADDLVGTVNRAARALCALSEERSAARPAPDKWSPREIVGHLVDSAQTTTSDSSGRNSRTI